MPAAVPAKGSEPIMTDADDADATRRRDPSIHLFGRTVRLPRSRPVRIAIGVVLVVLGCFGFLPILGFWMIPLGLLVLSYEFASVRRWRRRMIVRWERWRKRRR
jgi:hypothetical protein